MDAINLSHHSYNYLISNILILCYFLTVGYVRKEKSICKDYTAVSNSGGDVNLLHAKQECTKDYECAMIFDDKGEGREFYVCTYDAEIISVNDNSILYLKGMWVQMYCPWLFNTYRLYFYTNI